MHKEAKRLNLIGEAKIDFGDSRTEKSTRKSNFLILKAFYMIND